MVTVAEQIEVVVAGEVDGQDMYQKAMQAYTAARDREEERGRKRKEEREEEIRNLTRTLKEQLPEDLRPLLSMVTYENSHALGACLEVRGHDLVQISYDRDWKIANLGRGPYKVCHDYRVEYDAFGGEGWYVEPSGYRAFTDPYEAVGFALTVLPQYEQSLAEVHLKSRRGELLDGSRHQKHEPEETWAEAMNRKLDGCETVEEFLAIGVEALIALVDSYNNA